MWPPPRHPPRPMIGIGLPQPAFAPLPFVPQSQHVHPNANHQPFMIAAAARPPWHRDQGGDSWRHERPMAAAVNDSWRPNHNQQRMPWSNHELYRQQYSQIPLSRPYAQFAASGSGRRPEAASIVFGSGPNENQIPREYAAHQVDYEKQLRQQYESPKNNYNDFSEAPKNFRLDTETSARKIRLNWALPTLPSKSNKYKINLMVRLEQLEGGIGRAARVGELGLILNKTFGIHINKTEFETIPGSLYSIELALINQSSNEVVAMEKRVERAMFSITEMKVLLQKAINFTGEQMQPFIFVYRCKPKIYWDYIYQETGQIMHVYEKDSNGQAASPINQHIKGVFFSARTNPDGSLPNSSPFGDIRMVLPAMTLLDPQRVNLYFSDFYCNRVTHYVTVVVAIKNSDVDNFCREKLIILHPFDNPFLLFKMPSDSKGPITYSVNKKIWVEIYYTENIPLAWGRFDNIIPQGAGTSKIGGLPHNKSCRICNLYPTGMTAPQPPVDFEPLPEKKAEAMVKEAAEAELVDLIDSDDSCSYDDNSKAIESNGFETYEDLKKHLERIGKTITTADYSSELSSRSQSLKNVLSGIQQFIDEFKTDFTALDSRIYELKRSKSSSEKPSAGHTNSGTENAQMDKNAKSNGTEKRPRNTSFDQHDEAMNKRRRDTN